MKAISVSLSTKCVAFPRCSFCYQKKKNFESSSDGKWWALFLTLDKLIKKYPDVEVLWEYNGHNLGFIRNIRCHLQKQKMSLTTMHSVITPTLIGYLQNLGIQTVALSYDDEKLSRGASCLQGTEEWEKRAAMLQEGRIYVSCNYLLFPSSLPDKMLPIPKCINQLNLLSLKPDGKLNGKEVLQTKIFIEFLKGSLKNVPVVLDNCLAVQCGFIDKCQAGTDFMHVQSDGTVEECSFKTMCYLYRKGSNERQYEISRD